MNKTTILFISRAWGQHGGGMERLSFDFISEAEKHPGITVRRIVHEVKPNTTLLQVRLSAALFALLVIPRALFAATKVDVVHIADPVLSLVGYLIRIFLRKPVVVTVHGLDITYKNPIYQLYLRLFFHAFSLYLPISRHVHDMLQKRGVHGNIQIITPGVRDEYFDPSITRADLAKALDMSGEQLRSVKVLFTAGRLVPRKGHAWFVEHVLPRLPNDTIYVIAGSGPDAAAIARASERSGTSDRVKLLGRISDSKLKVLYNTVDIFVMPNIPVSDDMEGFGLVLAEAALCDRVVIASDIEGIRDAIADGKNGILVPAKDSGAWSDAIMSSLTDRGPKNPRAYTLTASSWQKKIEQYYTCIKVLV